MPRFQACTSSVTITLTDRLKRILTSKNDPTEFTAFDHWWHSAWGVRMGERAHWIPSLRYVQYLVRGIRLKLVTPSFGHDMAFIMRGLMGKMIVKAFLSGTLGSCHDRKSGDFLNSAIVITKLLYNIICSWPRVSTRSLVTRAGRVVTREHE